MIAYLPRAWQTNKLETKAADYAMFFGFVRGKATYPRRSTRRMNARAVGDFLTRGK